MNVLVVNGSSDLYGANRILLQVIGLLKPRKVFLVLPKKGLLSEYLIDAKEEFDHVKVIIEPMTPIIYRKMTIAEGMRLTTRMIAFRTAISRLIKENEIRWAYVNTLSCLFAVPPLKSCGLKVLIHVHEILENDRIPTRYINKFAVRWPDRVITVSNAVKSNLEAVCSKKRLGKIVTIVNGIADKYLPVSSSGAYDQNRRNLVTLFGRIKPEKGIWFFLDAIALLPEKILEESNFYIIGDTGPGGECFLQKLERDISVHPAKRFIVYKSFITDITEMLNRSDIIVVPSLMKDPFPTTILEGLSAGKPVIATDTGGSVEAITDGTTGFLIKPSDTVNFADRLKRLLESASLRKELGSSARSAFLQKFTLDVFQKNLLTEIDEFEKRIV